MPVYNKLKDMRHDKRMDQVDFADFLGVNKTLYNRWENQHGQPSMEWALKIAKKLDKHVDDFMYLD